MEDIEQQVWVIIPAFNEAQALPPLLRALTTHYHYSIVVIDDGSTDNTATICRTFPVHLLRHIINLGQGAALQTGITYALEHGANYLVSFDADGQMDPANIRCLVDPLIDGRFDVALGSRFLTEIPEGIPLIRQGILALGRIFTNFSTGLHLTDTHNGFRAFSREAAKRIRIRQNRMAHASELLQWIMDEQLRFCEIPVSIQYTEYSIAKGQPLWNLFNILWDLLFKA